MKINTTGKVIITDTTNVPGTIYSTERVSTIGIQSGYVTISNINIRTEADNAITASAYQNNIVCVLDNIQVQGEIHKTNGVSTTATITIHSGTFTPAETQTDDIIDFVPDSSNIIINNNTAIVTRK